MLGPFAALSYHVGRYDVSNILLLSHPFLYSQSIVAAELAERAASRAARAAIAAATAGGGGGGGGAGAPPAAAASAPAAPPTKKRPRPLEPLAVSDAPTSFTAVDFFLAAVGLAHFLRDFSKGTNDTPFSAAEFPFAFTLLSTFKELVENTESRNIAYRSFKSHGMYQYKKTARHAAAGARASPAAPAGGARAARSTAFDTEIKAGRKLFAGTAVTP